MEPEDSKQEDVKLVRGIEAGDRAAEECLLQKYRERVLLNVRVKMEYHVMAEDVCQEVLLALLETARKPEGIKEPENLGNLITVLCRNKAVDWFRKTKYQRREVDIDETQEEKLGGTHGVLTEDEKSGVDEVIGALKEIDKQILRLKYLVGLPYKQIAERLHRSESAVRKRGSRAYEQLRNVLG